MIQNEQENDHHSDIHTKDWFSPALASMARLNQIQANVHNMGFHSMSSLKASRNAKQRAKPPLPTGVLSQQNDTPESHWEIDTASRRPNGENENQNSNRLNYKELESTPPLSTVSYQRSAWGSDHSIPELIAQQGKKMTKLRPSSAKGQISARSKRPSKGRPQSAKEPLCSDRSEQDTQQEFEVCGQRKNLSNSRPPSRGSSAPSPNLNTVPGGGWAGLPPGHVIESGSQTLIREPIVPPSSPVPGESDEEDMIDSYCPQTPPPLLRRPLPQPIHLSLPSVSESADVMRDSYQPTFDDIDTQRLLVQADLYVDLQKTKEKGKEEMENILVSRNTTLPDHYDDGDSSTGFDEEMDTKRIMINISDRSQPKNNNIPSKNKQTHSAFLMPDDNAEHSYQPLTLVEGSKNDRTRAKSAPLRRSKESGSVVSKAGVRIREDRNVTVDITPRNIGRKVKEEGGLAPPQGYEMKSNNYSKKQEAYSQIIPPRKMNRSLVSMVTVEYPTGEVENINSNDSDAKVKGRKTKTMGEVETMVSHLSKLSHTDDDAESMTDSDCYSLVSQSLRKSEGEKNYYEISRSQSRQSNLSSAVSYNDKNLEKDTSSFVYKTTKTIEFDKEDLKENSTKMAINTHSTPTPKVNVKQRPPILPSTIKQQKTNESRGKHISEKTETGIDELAEMLKEAKSMAVTSLYDASQRRRPPSGKKTSQRPSSGSSGHTSKPRPFSAGSKLHSTTDSTREKKSVSEKPPKSHPNYMTRTGSSNCCRSSKAAKPSIPVVIKSVKPTIPMKTPESVHCRKVQSRMAELGIDVDPRVLEKALFAPAGESLYYEVPGNLPKNPTEGLLSHYKYWLSEDYKRIQTMEKRLAQDDHIRELQRLAAEKKAKKAAEKESKGKKKKKKRKLERSNSIV